MRYTQYLETLPAGKCPFCHSEGRRFVENEEAFLTYALAPYHRHHLLVIPKGHKKSFLELSRYERESVWELMDKGASVLRGLGYESFTFMIREGRGGAKSLEHVHCHLIPDTRMGDLDHDNNERVLMSDQEVQSISEEIKKIIQKG
ncbi:MAG: HIT domain-containing protein [Candidatus Moraniibacteriota bacterium]